MTKSTTPDETPAQPQQVSTKRQMAATGSTLLVSVVLGVLANYGIQKVAAQVHNAIIPPQPETNVTEN